jgi:hypothetical protein
VLGDELLYAVEKSHDISFVQPRPSGSGGRKAHMKEEPRELPPVSLHGVVLPPDSENQSGRK